MKNFLDSIDTVLLGRITYEQILTFDCDYPYAGKKSYVFSRNSKNECKNNVEFVSDPVTFTKDLLNSSGKDIWLVGGGGLISSFLKEDLIDEIILSYLPIVIGNGISLFQHIDKDIKFNILETVEYEGLIQIHFTKHV